MLAEFYYTLIPYLLIYVSWFEFIYQITERFYEIDGDKNWENYVVFWEMIYILAFWYTLRMLYIEIVQFLRNPVKYFHFGNILDIITIFLYFNVSILSWWFYEIAKLIDHDATHFDATTYGFKIVAEINKAVWSLSIIFGTLKLYKDLKIIFVFRKLTAS